MARQTSAGVLVYRHGAVGVEVLLVHPGGPFWRNKDAGAWSIPKGGIEIDEDPLAAAIREFGEEVGQPPPEPLMELRPVRLKSGKLVRAWAGLGDVDVTRTRSVSVTMEWPPRSGKMIEFPEVDQVQWFDLSTARVKMNPAQAGFLNQLILL